MKYISKENEWFDKGTEANIISGPWEVYGTPWAIMSGIKNGKKNKETCPLDEFEQVENIHNYYNNFNEYQMACMSSAAKSKNKMDQLIISALGLTGESGEFADLIKKVIGQGHKFNKEKLVKEIGDVLWYCSLAADALKIDLAEIASHNIEKLKKRYPNGFSTENSINRKKE